MATIVGTPAPDFLVGTADADLILGYDGNDTLLGGLGNDTLDGGTGADSMDGGDYNDTYYVDNISDVVAEQWNDALGGIDSVFSSVSHILGKGIENLTLTGSASNYGYGNSNNNVINGNSGNNYLFGADGNDSLYGGNGNDTLDGGTGADTMDGGDYNDTYYVDNIGDIVAEQWNDALGGIDSVFSSASHILGKGIENLTLSGSASNYGYGNGNNNVINGNSGNNYLAGLDGLDILNGGSGADTLVGGLGRDTMDGGDGNDTYYADAPDRISEQLEFAAGGIDTVYTSEQMEVGLGKGIENLILTGSASIAGVGNGYANYMQGNSGNNILQGREGNDTLYGGSGADVLMGGSGSDNLMSAVDGYKDEFEFDYYADHTVDTIVGAEFPVDQIDMYQPIFTALFSTTGDRRGELGAQYFHTGSGANGSGWFDGAGIWYDTSAGCLYYNPTQNVFGINCGDEVMFARFSGSIPSLSSSDFTLV